MTVETAATAPSRTRSAAGTAASGGYGGGISAYGPGRAGLQLNFVTVGGNHVGAAGLGGADANYVGFHGGPGPGGGIATGPEYDSGGGVTLVDSIVAANGRRANCNQIAPEASPRRRPRRHLRRQPAARARSAIRCSARSPATAG